MAVTASGFFVANFIDALKNTVALDLDAAGLKFAVFSNSITPDFSAAAANAAYSAGQYASNEVTGTNWSAGGVALATPTVTESPSTVIKWDADDISVASVTFTGARFGLIYDNSLTPKAAICGINFGGDYSPTNGTFSVTFAAGGIGTFDLY